MFRVYRVGKCLEYGVKECLEYIGLECVWSKVLAVFRV